MDYVFDFVELVECYILVGEEECVDLVGYLLGGIVCVFYVVVFLE